MHLEKKDLLLLIPATLLALAGLGPDDPWILAPCLGLSWLSFLLLCKAHSGPRTWRLLAAIGITVILSLVGIRRFRSVFVTPEYNKALPSLSAPASGRPLEQPSGVLPKDNRAGTAISDSSRPEKSMSAAEHNTSVPRLEIELAPYVLTQYETDKFADGTPAYGITYGLGAIVRVKSQDRETQYVRALEVVGNVDVDCQFYDNTIWMRNGHPPQTDEQIMHNCTNLKPFVRLAWNIPNTQQTRLGPHDEIYLKFDIAPPEAEIPGICGWECLGFHAGHTNPRPTTMPSLFDIVYFTDGFQSQFQRGSGEFRSPRFRPEVYSGQVKFRLKLDAGFADTVPTNIQPIRQTYFRIELPGEMDKEIGRPPTWRDSAQELFNHYSHR